MSGKKQKKQLRDPMRFQKRFASVVAIVLCAALILTLVAGLLVY